MNAIEIKNLKKHFGRVKAVDGISFEVKKGEIFGFLGPNGAGKTTTIRLLMDFIRPSSGKIRIFGHDAQKQTVTVKKDIGYLSPDSRLYEDWTGQDHISLSENIRGKSHRAEELIEKLGLNTKMRVRHLSTGNKQKLSLTLALMHEPKVIVLDEPTAGLDPILQNTIYGILKDLQKKGSSVFMSSHNLHEVEEICDRVGIIKEGKMVAMETIANLRKKRLYHVEVHFKNKFNPADFNLPDMTIVRENDSMISLHIKEDINPLLKKLARHDVKDIEINRASLEDIFLEFYKK